MNYDPRSAIVSALHHFSDRSCQHRAWFSASGPEVSSFAEGICQLFDDTGLGDDLDQNREIFSPEIDANLAELRRAISHVDLSLGPAALLDHPRMKMIREMARIILEQIADRDAD